MSIRGSSAIQLLYAYRLVKQITTPWEEWDAYKLGLIDKNGNRSRYSKTREEKKSFPILTVLAANIKRIVQKLPGGSSKFATLAASMFLLKEEHNFSEEGIHHILAELNIKVEPPENTDILRESVYYDDKLLRHVRRTGEKFLGCMEIYEGTDIITGKTIKFVDSGTGEVAQK